MDTKTFTPDATWNPSGDAVVSGDEILIEAQASYEEDFEGYNVGDVPTDFTGFVGTTFSVQNDGGQKVLQLGGTVWCMVYQNTETFVNGLLEVQYTAISNARQITAGQRVNPAARSGYCNQYINTVGFFQNGGGIVDGYVADYPYFNNTQQASGFTKSLPLTLKHQLADLGGGEVECQAFVDDDHLGNYIDTYRKYTGNRIAAGAIYIGGIGYIKFWPTKTGGFSKTFTPAVLNSWGRVMIAMDVKSSRKKRYSELFEYQIDAGGFNPLPDDGDISGAAAGSTITIRANSTLLNDFNSSEDITINSVGIEIDGIWDQAAAPTGVSAVAVSRTEARVSWTDNPLGAFYRVYYNTVNNFSTATIGAFASQGAQAANIDSLTPSQQYWFWVVCEDSAGLSSPEAGPATVTMPAPASDELNITEIETALYNWAAAVVAAAGSSAQVIFLNQDGPRPTPPFVGLNLIGPRMTGGSDHQSDQGTGDQGFIQQGMREFTVSVNVYAENDSLTLATKLHSSLNNPVYFDQLAEDKIGVGAVNDVNDLSQFLETEWERRSQFDFMIYSGVNDEYTSPIIETVDYTNNLP